MKNPLIEIGYNDFGKMDFRVSFDIRKLPLQERNKLREMIKDTIAITEEELRIRYTHKRIKVEEKDEKEKNNN